MVQIQLWGQLNILITSPIFRLYFFLSVKRKTMMQYIIIFVNPTVWELDRGCYLEGVDK